MRCCFAFLDGCCFAFLQCFFLLGRIETCLDILNKAGRVPEAAFLARTYMPSKVSEMVGLWRKDLERVSKRAAESLADPTNYANMFPDLALALKAETLITQQRQKGLPPAAAYPTAKLELDLNLVEEMQKLQQRSEAASSEAKSDVEPEEAGEAEPTAEVEAEPVVQSDPVNEEASADEPVAAADPAETSAAATTAAASDEVDLDDDELTAADTEAQPEGDEEFLAEFDDIDVGDDAALDDMDLDDFEKEVEEFEEDN